MDAVKFLEERNRMCDNYNNCVGCPMNDKPFCYPNDIITNDERKELVNAVEKWSCEHPMVTNGMKVLEMIPEGSAFIASADGIYVELRIKKSWWDAEYKEVSNETR